MEPANIAVFGSTHYVIRMKGKTEAHELSVIPSSTQAVVEQALAIGVDVVWVLPGSYAEICAREQPAAFTSSSEAVAVKPSCADEGLPTFVLAYRTKGTYQDRRAIKIGFPGIDTRWPDLPEIMSGTELLQTMLYLQYALGVSIEYSPGYTGRALMQALNKNHCAWVAAPTQALPEAVIRHKATDLHWKDPSLYEAEKHFGFLKDGGGYFHLYDKNSMYLGAATSACLGEGNPQYKEGIPFEPRTPGLWQVTIHEDPSGFYEPGDAWLWTPEVEYLSKHASIVVHWGYLWPTYHQTLRSWGSHLWKARSALSGKIIEECTGYGHIEARDHAYACVKAIATQGMGWLAHAPKEGSNPQFYRPDWWSMIVSEAKAKMLWKAQQLTGQGFPPVWVNVDALGFITDSPHGLPIQLSPQGAGGLGGFKHVASVPVTEELLAMFAPTVSFRKAHDYIHALTQQQHDEG